MEEKKDYFAFISYKSEDVEWATWLQHELEHYHLPASFNGRTDVPQELRPVFRDIDELSAGNLPEQIKKALVNSQNLIVICSPQAAKSPWVNQEVETFISLGKTDQIYPFIVEGNSPSEFFPPALLKLPKNKERLGGDVSKKGRDAAFVKVVAGMLEVGFDSLWNRYEKEKAEEERKQREQRDNLLRVQSRFLAEKANALIDEGDSYTARLLALEALPQNMEYPNRPYVVEAEIALRKAFQRDNIVLNGHTGSISSISISPDNNMLASASLDNYIRLWDLQSGRCLSLFEKPSIRIGKFRFDVFDGLVDEIDYYGFNSVSFSPDGNYIVAAGRDSAIYIWNLSSKECITKIYNFDIHYGVNVVKFSLDGKTVISGGMYLNEEHEYIPGLSVWDRDTGQHLFSRDTKDSVYDISFSNDGTKLATIEYNHIHIWETDNYNQLKCIGYRTKRNNALCSKNVVFSPNGDIIASSSDETIHIWEIESGKQIQYIRPHNSGVVSIAFSVDGKYIFSGGKDGIIHKWDIQSGNIIKEFNSHKGKTNDIKISSNGKYIVSAGDDQIIKLLDIECDKPLFTFNLPSDHDEIDNFHFDIQDDYQIRINKNGNIELLDTKFNNIIKTISRENQYSSPYKAISIDKALEVTYDLDENSLIIQNNKCDLCYSFRNPSYTEIQFAVFSPDGNNLLTLAYDKDICIHRGLPHTQQEIETNKDNWTFLKGHTAIVRWASFSMDGNYIVSVSEDMTIRVWDFSTCNCIQTINTYDDFIDFVDFTPNGGYIYSKNFHNNIKIWKFQTLQELIDETNCKFKMRQLNLKERKKYYLQ